MHSLFDQGTVDDVQAAVTEGAAAALDAARAIYAERRGDFATASAAFVTVLATSTDHRLLFAGFQYHFRRNELEQAEAFVRRRLALAQPGSAAMARALTNLGLIHLFRDELSESESAQRAAIEIDRALGDDVALARDLGNLALVPEKRGDLVEAERLYRESLAIAERLGADAIIATKLVNLGEIAVMRGRPEDARALWTRAITLFERLGQAKYRDDTAAKLASLR